MGIAALTCIGMGVYRMLESLAASDDKKQELSDRRQRMRYILDMRKSRYDTVQPAAACSSEKDGINNTWENEEVAVDA